jgi:hypothetical protein
VLVAIFKVTVIGDARSYFRAACRRSLVPAISQGFRPGTAISLWFAPATRELRVTGSTAGHCD